MLHVLEIFSDYTCPWCYFVIDNIDKLKQKIDVVIKWVGFCMHPNVPDAGQPLEDRFSGLGLNISGMVAHLKRTADRLGLPFISSTMLYNSRKAQELVKWADTLGCGEDLHKQVFYALFAQGRNIAELELLKGLAAKVGLSPDEAEKVLIEGRFRTAVDRDWQRSREMRITTGPTFICNGRVLVGAQSCESLKKLVCVCAQIGQRGPDQGVRKIIENQMIKPIDVW